MSKKNMKPVAAAIGAAFVGSMMLAGSANAASNPFGMAELNGGYAQIAQSAGEGKCGAGKCGGSKAAEKTGVGSFEEEDDFTEDDPDADLLSPYTVNELVPEGEMPSDDLEGAPTPEDTASSPLDDPNLVAEATAKPIPPDDE